MSQPRPVSQTVVGGIDTHQDTHTAAALTSQGVLLGWRQFPANPSGYAQLHAWLGSHGQLLSVGIEGTGAYGAGLARHLRATGTQVVEVDRPDRTDRRQRGKSDPIDAENAARAVISTRATGTPKDRDSHVEALRNLHVARRAAIQHRADLQRRIKTLIVTAPDQLREQLRHLRLAELIRTCQKLRPESPRHVRRLMLL
ncbi:transposase [Tessaracoccus sp. OS52]|uniref:IS110 family transposase n=1 Tax=Tessaracoccus sp. OS52 TaxID=2886691 RepID=UPI001D126F41|nr:transposase [Tessaracoccus sp. OS52]MCC2594604.1 transposase [Tessaracoccus sp. OS52]